MRTILIVDDDDDFREMLRVVLASCDFSVLAADSGAAALAITSSHNVDVVLTDFQMPAMDGLQLCQALRRQRPAVPVWLMTGAVDFAIERTLAAGGCGTFRKPFRAPQIAKAINEHLDVTATISAA